MRILGRVIGGILLAGGLGLAYLGIRYGGNGGDLAGAIIAGGVLAIPGFLFTGLPGAIRSRFRRARTRMLAQRMTSLLESPAEAAVEIASVRWRGSRNGAQLALSWSLDASTTQVSIQIEGGSPGTFRIVPSLHRGGRIIGGRTIPTGDVDFDRTYLTRSEPTSLIPDLFAESRRDALVNSLFTLPECASVRIFLTLSDLRFRVPRLLQRLEDLERLFTVAAAFAAAIRDAARASGYAILTVGAGTSARCPVCVSLLESEVVLCIRCRTPHHRGCWEYAGECATFACGGRRWIPA